MEAAELIFPALTIFRVFECRLRCLNSANNKSRQLIHIFSRKSRMASTLVDNGPAGPSMLAWRVHKFGPPEAMILERVPRPDPSPGEVLVDVHAAGVGPWDGWIRAGKSALPQPLPLTLGSDLSGTVAAVGSGISEMAIGDQVFGVTNTQFLGAYAEYAVASPAQ